MLAYFPEYVGYAKFTNVYDIQYKEKKLVAKFIFRKTKIKFGALNLTITYVSSIDE